MSHFKLTEPESTGTKPSGVQGGGETNDCIEDFKNRPPGRALEGGRVERGGVTICSKRKGSPPLS